MPKAIEALKLIKKAKRVYAGTSLTCDDVTYLPVQKSKLIERLEMYARSTDKFVIDIEFNVRLEPNGCVYIN